MRSDDAVISLERIGREIREATAINSMQVVIRYSNLRKILLQVQILIHS